MGQWNEVIDYKHVHACTRVPCVFVCVFVHLSVCLSVVFTELV